MLLSLQDLAARNILVDKDETTKVADFGLSRETVEDVYEVTRVGAMWSLKHTFYMYNVHVYTCTSLVNI